MVPSEKNRLLTLLAVLLSTFTLVLVLVLYETDGGQRNSAELLRSHFWTYRYQYLIGAAVTSTALTLVIYLGTAFARQRAIAYFLDHMHARFFTRRSKRDPEYRISLFAPSRFGQSLRCCYRTDGKRSGKRWSQTRPGDGRSADGVVGAVWITGMTVQVGSPPKRPTEDELADYRLRSHVTGDVQDDRSWPNAALLGIPVQSSQTGLPIAVLLIERDRSDAHVGNITMRDYEHDIHVCTMILQGHV